MSGNKKYYWLKLKEDFFRDKKIKKLRSIAGGDTYTIIYLKMQLLSLKNEGKLFFENVEDSFIEEIALEIDEKIEDVKVCVLYLIKTGLIEVIDESEYVFKQTQECIGSETSSAERVRRFRERENLKKEQQALLCNTSVTNCNTEIDIDIEKEKDIDIEIDKNAFVQKQEQKQDWEAKFDCFWNIYPKKQNKKKVYLWFKNKKPNDVLFKTIMEKLKIFIDSADWKKENGKYVPMPTTWLNGERWNDEIKKVSSNNIFYEIGKEEGLF